MPPDSMIAWASLIMATQGLAVIDASFTIELGTERFQTKPIARRSAGKSLANSPLESFNQESCTQTKIRES